MNDRLERIGQSWAKHGFSASEDDLCGEDCIPFGGRSYLGVGCADVYRLTTHALQAEMGPRSEINPWTGAFVYPDSHMDVGR